MVFQTDPKVFIALLSPLVISGCYSTPYVKNDTKRLITPEIHSEPFKVTLAAAASKSDEITPRYDELNVNDGDLSIEARMTTGGGGEIFISSGEVEGAGFVYQFMGEHFDVAPVHNISAAISAGYYRFKSDQVASDDYTGWEVEQHMVDVSLIAGFRTHDRGLLFASVFYRGGDIDVNVIPELSEQDELSSYFYRRIFTCDDLSDNCTGNQFEATSQISGFNFGYRHDFYKWLSLTGEIVYYQEDVFDKKQSDQAINFKVGFHF
ncbi:hypothetical protein J1N51_00470 [Psychrosphaera ytuae]|uniref:Uncharacterized protein n=1 Tax=Psychrosphaera ytuae TaxID=2820710 RepID=A0A975DBQ7_9GAMM|nr:hypothetical protein [Psychrosphaera ytuae]QTH64008.1 hypothetical protein J1N51_00470 [Psychrosphaera ytuae]